MVSYTLASIHCLRSKGEGSSLLTMLEDMHASQVGSMPKKKKDFLQNYPITSMVSCRINQ